MPHPPLPLSNFTVTAGDARNKCPRMVELAGSTTQHDAFRQHVTYWAAVGVDDSANDHPAVMLVTAPGEARSGHARLFTELANGLRADGLAVVVVSPGVHGRAQDVAEAWPEQVNAALDWMRAEGLNSRLAVTRGLSVAVAHGLGLPGLALHAPLHATASPVECGLEDLPRARSQVAAWLHELAAASLVPPRDWSQLRAGQDREATSQPLKDPLFRLTWERALVVATVRCLANTLVRPARMAAA
jgi:hypothetical protein